MSAFQVDPSWLAGLSAHAKLLVLFSAQYCERGPEVSAANLGITQDEHWDALEEVLQAKWLRDFPLLKFGPRDGQELGT